MRIAASFNRGRNTLPCRWGILLLAFISTSISLADAEGEKSGLTDPTERLEAIADNVWNHQLEQDAFLRARAGLPVNNLPDITLEAEKRNAEFAQDILEQLETVDAESLEHEKFLLYSILVHTMTLEREAAQYYWLDSDVTTYGRGRKVLQTNNIIDSYQINSSADLKNYLNLVSEYGDMIEQILAKTRQRAERGLFLPKAALPGVIGMWRGFLERIPTVLGIKPENVSRISDSEMELLEASIELSLAERIIPALVALIAEFESEEYLENAPDDLGVRQYPGGEAYYLYKIRYETGLALSPEEIHETGLREMEDVQAEMQEIRDSVGFEGSAQEFHAMLQSDPRFLLNTPQAVEQNYQRYLDMMEGVLPTYFSELPEAEYGLKRLDLSVEDTYSFGYYQRTTPEVPVGYYRFNASKLDQRTQVIAQHLIYHELIPGHHFSMQLQKEKPDRHPLRRFNMAGLHHEGWAEYAASLAREAGIQGDPYDRYGDLLMLSFLTSRLVVDTGLNWYGWDMQKAREYMATTTLEPDAVLEAEILRYASHIPGQALCYRLGRNKMWELRRKAERELGEDFDIREFHQAMLGSGYLPTPVLEQHIDWFINTRRPDLEINAEGSQP